MKGKRIVIDLGDWQVDGWEDQLAKAIEVDTAYGDEITITLQMGDLYEAAVRKIVKDGIEAFLEGDTYATLEVDGLRIHARELGEEPAFIPWLKRDMLMPEIGSRKVLDALIEWLQQECSNRGMPWPPPERWPQEGFVIVPREPSRKMLDALYGGQPTECDMTRDQAVAAWEKAIAAAVKGWEPRDG